MIVAECLKVGQSKHLLVRDLVCTAMSSIVHDQCSISLILLNEGRNFWICIACGRILPGIGIPHHLAHEVSRMAGSRFLGRLVYVSHVNIPIAVVAHEHKRVLPRAYIFVLRIANGLINKDLCFSFRCYGEAANGHI